MLFDADAQIIKLDNIPIARTWLWMDTEAEASVFLDSDLSYGDKANG